MKTLQLLILFFSVLLITTGCKPDLVKSASTLSSAAELKSSLDETNELFDTALASYEANKKHFDETERKLIYQGVQKIQLSKNELNALFHAHGIDTAVNYTRFINTWGDAKVGYQLVRSVLKSRKDIGEEHQDLIQRIHHKVTYMDSLVDNLTPESEQIDFKAIADIITATATLVGTVKPLVSQQ